MPLSSPTQSIRVGTVVAGGAIVVRPIPIQEVRKSLRLTISGGGFSAAQAVLLQALVSSLGRIVHELTLSQRVSTQGRGSGRQGRRVT